MENQQEKNIFNFIADENTKFHLKGISQWARVNAITGFCSLGTGILTIVLTTIKFDFYNGTKNIFYSIIGWAVSLIMNIILLSAANNIKKAVSLADQGAFNKGLSDLASYLKIAAIVIIIILILFLLVLLYFYFLKSPQVK